MIRFAVTISKCPDFLPEMSGILDTRIPPFCNSEQACPGLGKAQLKLELCFTSFNNRCIKLIKLAFLVSFLT